MTMGLNDLKTSEIYSQLALKDPAKNKNEWTQQKTTDYGKNYLLINGLKGTPSSPISASPLTHAYGLSVSYNQLT